MNFSILRRTFSAAFVALAATTVSAQSFTVHMSNGTSATYKTEDVDSISFFDDGNSPTLFKQPANTYIVTKGGEYAFYPKRPSGSTVEGVVKADWIWGSKTNDNEKIQSIVRNVRLEDGKIKFTASGNEGTAVIAGFDAAGTVKWVWLVWVTDFPTDMEFEDGAMFMDRYIGATSADPKEGAATWASVVYQWGRPVPIFSGFGEEWGEENAMQNAIRATIMNPDYNFKWTLTKESAKSVEESIANPTTFYCGYAGHGDWLAERNDQLWLSTKTDYDPSPAGYQMPVFQDWGENFFSYLTPYDAEGQTGGYYEYNGHRHFFPNGVKNRMWDTGENVIGYPGFMMWNAEYYLEDMGFFEDPNFPFTFDEAIEMGLIYYLPSRLHYQWEEGAMLAFHGVGNPAFAHPILCKRIEK